MIGFLQGKILDTDGKKALLLTENGIGYEINYGYYLEKDSLASLFTHHHISENDQSLWGFNSLRDKKMFELLKTVNKVGSSKAYPLITIIGTDSVIQAIQFDQPEVLVKAPGIGKKMAEQIILSLKDKIEKFSNGNVLVDSPASFNFDVQEPQAQEEVKVDNKVFNEVILALDSLGYKDKEIAHLVKNQITNGVTSSEDIIKHVLKEI